MLTLISMDEGERVEKLFEPENRRQIDEAIKSLRDSGQVLGVIGPDHRAGVQRQPRHERGREPAQLGRAARAVASATERAPEADKAAREEDFGVTAERLLAIPADGAEPRQPGVGQVPALRQPGRDPQRAALVLPRRNDHAQIVTRLEGNEEIETEGKNAELIVETMSNLDLDGATTVTTGAPVLLKSINDYLKGGMLTLGGIAIAIMIVILLVLFDVRWRLLPLGGDPHRRHLGVRPGRLPRHPPDARHHRRPAR